MRTVAIAALVCGLATPALATEWVNCGDGSGEASFAWLAGAGLGVIQIAGMTIAERFRGIAPADARQNGGSHVFSRLLGGGRYARNGLALGIAQDQRPRRIGLAESIYLGEEGRVRRTEQIVLVGQVPVEGTTVKWALTRMEG